MADINVDIGLVCAECGKELDTAIARRPGLYFAVRPCEKCKDEAYETGFSDGKIEAETEREK